ncbi:4-hydroxy-tetrahydrodipicolinate reductase [Anditalea andensis]|uniref:4-hydroxy-tetrahydrodipicolinate reductase n=1 Tax=Anditalea andensis TaxID=1048983 RepID=A0A074KUR7_9BACT|nr:4-hydroxy-tetrahydrodipicolinate reductase [Anditalea andensis]KEO72619.1 dihydrodipicolinate reductase [Anditalea andensis]
MNILILGYGKMGKIISAIAEERGHTIIGKITEENISDLDALDGTTIDVAIEFSQPEAAISNITWALEQGIPVVSGTTGWLDKKPDIERLALSKGGTFFYASNFSIGVNIFFKINRYLAKLMDEQPSYKVSMEEVHHTEKKDAPSGTAITLAEDIINKVSRAKRWNLDTDPIDNEHNILISSKRINEVPGTHTVTYQSDIDDIEIKHTAHNRKGFALGAVLVAEWIKDRKGLLTMNDFLSF